MPLGRKRILKPTGQLSSSESAKVQAILQYTRKMGKIILQTPPVMRKTKGSR
jgi:hypothetical protein